MDRTPDVCLSPDSGGIADVSQPPLGAKAPAPSSFNELIGRDKNGLWYRKAECLCGPRVEDQFEFRRSQNWKVVRPGAAQNLTSVNAGLAVGIRQAGTIAHEPAIRWKLPDVENTGQPMTERERQDLTAPAVEERIVLHDQACDTSLD